MQNNKPLEEAVVEVRLPALSKQAAQVISDIDKFLDYFQKARGTLPQRIPLRQRHWHQIRRSMERAAREATLRRIARGVQRYVIEAGEPFIVPVTHAGDSRVHPISEPLRTITTAHRGEFMVAAPVLAQLAHACDSNRCKPTTEPLGAIHAGGGSFAVASAYLMQANGGFNETPGHDLRRPMSTITNRGSQQQLVTAHLAHLRGNCDARDPGEPLRTISAGGEHHGIVTAHLTAMAQNVAGIDPTEPLPTVLAGAARFGVVECHLSPEAEEGALRVAAFLMRYYGEGGQLGDLREPMATITTRDRLALITVTIQGQPFVVVDIGLRMLTPRELYRTENPIGEDNDRAIVEAAQHAALVVCGWGNHGALHGRGQAVLQLLRAHGIRPHALRVTGAGQPGHPLYIGYDVQPTPMEVA